MSHATKKIRSEGKRGNFTYHLNTGDPVPAAAPASSPVVKQEVKPLIDNLLRDHPALTDVQFTIMLSDDNHLHLNFGDDVCHLNPEQTMRLYVFMHRIRSVGHIEGTRA